ncbi:MAG: 2-oxo acid dehydrogenase subunit E2, partial [Ktedonobacteraceae bacterium]|nr:2-oxo acid dehydrogenase subunit E2 [Ktedonobacteraceae bacterium]
MSAEIRVPTLGESIVDATIASWLKHEGDAVQQGEALVELETDKVNVEVNAEQSGILQKIVKQAGDTVAVGDVIGMLGEAGAVPAGANMTQPAVQQPSVQLQSANQAQPAAQPQLETQRPPSPLARRIAAEHNVDISQVRGSSPHGRVTRDDVIHYLEQGLQPPAQVVVPPVAQVAPVAPSLMAAPALVQEGRREERVRMSRRRQTIAQRLVEAQQTAAMLTTFNEIDMSAVINLRSRRKESFKERYGISLGFMSFFSKAVVGALKAFPHLNAEIQGNEMVIKHYYDIGIAVGTDEGLV